MKTQIQSTKSSSTSRVALVCDWLTEVGGAERVLLSLHQLYPDAPIYTSQYRPHRINWFSHATVHTGWLNYLPANLRRFIGPLRQFYFSHLDLSAFDIVISVTGAEAKSVITKTAKHQALHFCYCHVPTQYYWAKYDEYLQNPGFGFLDPLVRIALKLIVRPLRAADLRAAKRPDYFISISQYAASQIKQYYGREARIIHPPVATQVFHRPEENLNIKTGNCQTKTSLNYNIKNNKKQIKASPNQTIKKHKNQTEFTEQNSFQSSTVVENLPDTPYFINFSRQVTWKRLDLIIRACLAINHPLVLIGEGPEHSKLIKLAESKPGLITFLPRLNQDQLRFCLTGAKAFIFPSEEPFGIAPVEALAAGCPVIAYAKGGATDFILHQKNGLLFHRQSVNSLVSALQKFEKTKFLSPSQISSTAEGFSEEAFKTHLLEFIREKS